MGQVKLLFYLLFFLLGLVGDGLTNGNTSLTKDTKVQSDVMKEVTPMEALDRVKAVYATNFEKVELEETGEYYYKLPTAEYYLVYEGLQADNRNYLFHLYEFVLDEPDTGIGHTYTYGWYTVDKYNGVINSYE